MTPVSHRNDSRTVFGWAMYDWANSAYITAGAGVLLPILFTNTVVPEDGVEIFGRTFSGETLWALTVGLGALVLFLAMPVLGAIADFSNRKKRLLQFFAYMGSIATVGIVFVSTGDVALTLVLFLVAHTGFVAGNVMYNGFLPEISTDETIDRISARGFAFGYLGGGLQLVLAAALIVFHEQLGLSEPTAERLGIAMAGVWWAGFGAFSFTRLGDWGKGGTIPERFATMPNWAALTRLGFSRTIATARQIGRHKHLLLFIVAFILYNDGVQTVIAMTSAYASQTLDLSTTTILTTFLLVQFVAFPGALLVARLAHHIGTKQAIAATLVVWVLVAIGAFLLPAGAAAPFYALGAVTGFVLGGVQALSRSLYGSMIPEEASAEFFGFFAVFSRFSAIWGPLLFALITVTTGSARNAIVSVAGFFVIGGVLLAFVDVDEARATRTTWRFEGPATGEEANDHLHG
jgi:UMF1 family MFS transporter